MSRSLSPCPAEVQVERLIAQADRVILVVRAVRGAVPCPGCTRLCRRVHSYYARRLADLPWNGAPVEIRLQTRRFFCDAGDCPRRIFTERLKETTEAYARRTCRMQQALRWLGLALGGEAGAHTAHRLGLVINGDTVLRHLRRMWRTETPPLVSPQQLSQQRRQRRFQRYQQVIALHQNGVSQRAIAMQLGMERKNRFHCRHPASLVLFPNQIRRNKVSRKSSALFLLRSPSASNSPESFVA